MQLHGHLTVDFILHIYNYMSLCIHTVVEEVFRSFTSVKALIAHCKNTLLQVKVLQENVTQVKVL